MELLLAMTVASPLTKSKVAFGTALFKMYELVGNCAMVTMPRFSLSAYSPPRMTARSATALTIAPPAKARKAVVSCILTSAFEDGGTEAFEARE
jgi:hypothetical protein